MLKLQLKPIELKLSHNLIVMIMAMATFTLTIAIIHMIPHQLFQSVTSEKFA